MLGREILALTVAGAAAFLLFNDGGGGPPQRAVAQLKPPVLTLDVPLDGTLYFAAFKPRTGGAGNYDEESVFRLGPGDARPVRLLPGNIRTWHVSAWGDDVVVSTESEDFFAPAGMVDANTGRTIADDAHGPAAGPGGSAAYQGFVRNRKVSAAFVRWSSRGRFRPIARSGIWGNEFLPDGRLVVLQRRDGRPWIRVHGRRGLQREFRARGNPQYELLTTTSGLIGYEGGTGRLRVYTPRGRLRANLDVDGWIPAGTRGDRFLLVEKEGDRIASLSVNGDLEVVGRHDPGYEVFNLEWEPR